MNMHIVSFLIHLLTLMSIFAILTLSMNIAVGWTGLVNLGHFALAGVSAYAWAILILKFGVNPFIALLAAFVLTAALAYIISLLTKNIRGDQFTLITFFFGFIIWIILLNWKSVTRGSLGIPAIPRLDILKDDFNFFVLVLVMLFAVYFFTKRLTESSFGRALEAVRDNELAAKIIGKNTGALKSKSLVISSLIAGIGGILLASFIAYIDPNTYNIHDLVFILTALIVGGLASIQGSLIGVIILFSIIEILRTLAIPPEILGPLRQILYALFLILLIIYRPKGILGKIELE